MLIVLLHDLLGHLPPERRGAGPVREDRLVHGRTFREHVHKIRPYGPLLLVGGAADALRETSGAARPEEFEPESCPKRDIPLRVKRGSTRGRPGLSATSGAKT